VVLDQDHDLPVSGEGHQSPTVVDDFCPRREGNYHQRASPTLLPY
jgi:hypothetical protein